MYFNKHSGLRFSQGADENLRSTVNGQSANTNGLPSYPSTCSTDQPHRTRQISHDGGGIDSPSAFLTNGKGGASFFKTAPSETPPKAASNSVEGAVNSPYSKAFFQKDTSQSRGHRPDDSDRPTAADGTTLTARGQTENKATNIVRTSNTKLSLGVNGGATSDERVAFFKVWMCHNTCMHHSGRMLSLMAPSCSYQFSRVQALYGYLFLSVVYHRVNKAC